MKNIIQYREKIQQKQKRLKAFILLEIINQTSMSSQKKKYRQLPKLKRNSVQYIR